MGLGNHIFQPLAESEMLIWLASFRPVGRRVGWGRLLRKVSVLRSPFPPFLKAAVEQNTLNQRRPGKVAPQISDVSFRFFMGDVETFYHSTPRFFFFGGGEGVQKVWF